MAAATIRDFRAKVARSAKKTVASPFAPLAFAARNLLPSKQMTRGLMDMKRGGCGLNGVLTIDNSPKQRSFFGAASC